MLRGGTIVAVGSPVQIVDSRMRQHIVPDDWLSQYLQRIPDDVIPILDQYKLDINRGLYTVVLEPMHIPTGESIPIFRKPYRLPQKERDQVRLHVEKLLAEGIIRESSSSWGSPC